MQIWTGTSGRMRNERLQKWRRCATTSQDDLDVRHILRTRWSTSSPLPGKNFVAKEKLISFLVTQEQPVVWRE